MPPRTWSPTAIRDFLLAAERDGTARASLLTPGDAERFRFAIYNFRRRNPIGESVIITLDGADVVGHRAPPTLSPILSTETEAPAATTTPGDLP